MSYTFVCVTSDIDECALNISECTHNCTNTIGSYYCLCYSGYQLAANQKNCSGKYRLLNTIYMFCYDELWYFQNLDINECTLNISGCNQNCTNMIGSYFCSCYSGYEIQNDNRNCVGKDLSL